MQTAANFLVEEYMLLANMRVAAIIARAFPKHALLRWGCKQGLQVGFGAGGPGLCVTLFIGRGVGWLDKYMLLANMLVAAIIAQLGLQAVLQHVLLRQGLQLGLLTPTRYGHTSKTMAAAAAAADVAIYCAAVRRHPPPSARKINDLVKVGEKLGVKVDYTTAGALAMSLQAMRDACKDEATSQVCGGLFC
jgi:hypothetical protein